MCGGRGGCCCRSRTGIRVQVRVRRMDGLRQRAEDWTAARSRRRTGGGQQAICWAMRASGSRVSRWEEGMGGRRVYLVALGAGGRQAGAGGRWRGCGARGVGGLAGGLLLTLAAAGL